MRQSGRRGEGTELSNKKQIVLIDWGDGEFLPAPPFHQTECCHCRSTVSFFSPDMPNPSRVGRDWQGRGLLLLHLLRPKSQLFIVVFCWGGGGAPINFPSPLFFEGVDILGIWRGQKSFRRWRHFSNLRFTPAGNRRRSIHFTQTGKGVEKTRTTVQNGFFAKRDKLLNSNSVSMQKEMKQSLLPKKEQNGKNFCCLHSKTSTLEMKMSRDLSYKTHIPLRPKKKEGKIVMGWWSGGGGKSATTRRRDGHRRKKILYPH